MAFTDAVTSFCEGQASFELASQVGWSWVAVTQVLAGSHASVCWPHHTSLAVQAAFSKHELGTSPVTEDDKNFGLGSGYKPERVVKKLAKVVAVEAVPLPEAVVKVWAEEEEDEESDADAGSADGDSSDESEDEEAKAAAKRKRRAKRAKRRRRGEDVPSSDEEGEGEEVPKTPQQIRDETAEERSNAFHAVIQLRERAELAARRGMVANRLQATAALTAAWRRYQRAAVDVMREVFGAWCNDVRTAANDGVSWRCSLLSSCFLC